MFHYLQGHPQIKTGNKKELHFFDQAKYFKDNKGELTIYDSWFPERDKAEYFLFGEATPIYSYWEQAAERIWHYNKNMKFILILRNPITRAFSHWNMEYKRKRDKKPFSYAIRNEASRSRESLPEQHRIYSYTDRGFYTEQIRRLLRFFPKEQLLIIKYDEFLHMPEASLTKVADFLKIMDGWKFSAQKHNQIPYYQSISADDWAYLRDIFFYEIKSLEKLTGWDCTDWLEQRT